MATAAVGVLGGLGGLAALWRARSQNRVEAGRLRLDRESGFRDHLLQEVARLSALVQTLDQGKDKLEEKHVEVVRELSRLQERDAQKSQQIEALQAQNALLVARVDEQDKTIADLTNQRATALDRLQVAQAKSEFLERENNELRLENHRLRQRVEGQVAEGHASISSSSGGGDLAAT